MRTKGYLIKYSCYVYEDDYLNGEGKGVNYWYDTYDCGGLETPEEAIEALFKHKLGYNYNPEYRSVYDGIVRYSVMVDCDNAEASENEIVEWQQGKTKLWVNDISIEVFCVEPVELPNYN